MQHSVLLGRDSWMRFEQRTHTILPRQPSQPTFGSLSFCIPYAGGLSTFANYNRSTDDVYHLRYAGLEAVSFSPKPSLVPVNLVYPSGVTALTGHYLVDILPRDGLSSETEIFEAHGHQHIPLWAFTDLEPGNIPGTSTSPLIQMPLTTFHDLPTDPKDRPPTTTDVHALHNNMPLADVAASPTDNPPTPKTPCPMLLERVSDDQQRSLLLVWYHLLLHLRSIMFDLHGSGWSPAVITALGDVFCDFPDVFSISKTDFGC